MFLFQLELMINDKRPKVRKKISQNCHFLNANFFKLQNLTEYHLRLHINEDHT